jgi:hypothetical protein
MKKITLFYSSTLFLVMLGFSSCSKDEVKDVQPPTTVSTGDYWPTAINNSWVLNTNGEESKMSIISTDVFDGATYYKFDQLIGSGGALTAWLKKSNGNYYLKVGEIELDVNGLKGKQTGYEYVFFKDYLDVNQTWTGTYNQETIWTGYPAITTKVNYTGTILERGLTLVVNGKTYKDVIQFKYQVKSFIGNNPAGDFIFNYWICKDVGVIKVTAGTGTTSLVSYSLK